MILNYLSTYLKETTFDMLYLGMYRKTFCCEKMAKSQENWFFKVFFPNQVSGYHNTMILIKCGRIDLVNLFKNFSSKHKHAMVKIMFLFLRNTILLLNIKHKLFIIII